MTKHIWVILATFLVADPTAFEVEGEVTFGQNDLVGTSGPGCMNCGVPYSPDVSPICVENNHEGLR